MTLISVIIPTRNRPHLLRYALQSTIDQVGFEDYEVVVSDNSLDQSAAAVVEPWADHPRVRYVHTRADLDVYASWSFALEQARGDYSFLLADDDSLLPGGLAKLAQAIVGYGRPDVLGVASCWYSHPSRRAPPHNAISFDQGWTQEGMRDPRAMLKLFFSFGRPSFSPTYIMVARHVRDGLAERGVAPYMPLYPDYAMMACALALAQRAAVMRVPTVVHGYAAESMGEHTFGRDRADSWESLVGKRDLFQHSPLQGYLFSNGWLETLMRVKAALPKELETIEIHWLGCLELFSRDLLRDALWRDVRSDVRAFLAVIDAMEGSDRTTVLTTLKGTIRSLMRAVEVQAWDQEIGPEPKWLLGSDHGFDDILGAAQRAEALFRMRERRGVLMDYILNGDTNMPTSPGQGPKGLTL
ncbi:MAG: glycosyltransferase family A protein [Myxococcota bacterium]